VIPLVVAAILLVAVAVIVPWKDVLVIRTDGSTARVEGTIEGDWRSDAIDFLPEKGGKELPGELRAELEREGRIRVSRHPPTDGAPALAWEPGLGRVFRDVRPGALCASVVFLLGGFLLTAMRWWRLLRLAGSGQSFLAALRLAFAGLFFSVVLPGLAGGDVARSLLTVRENPERRADALASVVLDRFLGLLALAALGAVGVLFAGDAFHVLRLPVLVAFLAIAAGLWIALHEKLRRWLRIDRLLGAIPFGAKIQSLDRAFLRYSGQRRELAIALGISVVNHVLVGTSVFLVGRAFGAELPFVDLLLLAWIANALSTVPIAPGGWGVGEVLYGSLFTLVGAPGALGIAVSVGYRLLQTLLGVAGGLFLLVPSKRDVSPAQPEAQARP
jgi:uncharacterized protein (TIRG00374 family)